MSTTIRQLTLWLKVQADRLRMPINLSHKVEESGRTSSNSTKCKTSSKLNSLILLNRVSRTKEVVEADVDNVISSLTTPHTKRTNQEEVAIRRVPNSNTTRVMDRRKRVKATGNTTTIRSRVILTSQICGRSQMSLSRKRK